MNIMPPQARQSPFAPVKSAPQSGFTLIELMISVVISLLLVAALTALFVNLSRTNREMAKTNIQIENGRFAVQLLQSDLTHAGFWGNYVPQYDDLSLSASVTPTGAPTAIPDPCLAFSAANWTAAHRTNLIDIPVQSYDIPSPVPSPTVPATTCSSIVVNPKANTDVLVARHTETCVPGIGNCEADVAGRLYFQSSLCEIELNAGLFYVLDTANFTLKRRGCTGPPATTTGVAAEKRRFISNIYYIRDYAVTAGDGIPTLMRSQFDLSGPQPAVPLINGIEGFRVEFGVDNISETGIDVISDPAPANRYTSAILWANPANQNAATNRGDGVPDGDFIRCTTASPCTFARLSNVVAVKLYVLARTDKISPGYTDTKTYTLGSTTLGPFNDKYKRHVFSTTVRLTSISGRRETP